MRILHTSDWHLGRQLHGVSLLDDQRHVLDQLAAVLTAENIDALVIAGDVYDRSLPPVEAVKLLNRFVSHVSGELKLPIIMIGGNHDSGERLDFGGQLLAGAGLHIAGALSRELDPVVLEDAHGEVAFYSIPYADPATVRDVFDIEVRTHDEAMAFLCREIREHNPHGRRAIVLSHCFLAGGEESESERPLTVGGVASVSPKHFVDFTYTALGHLHAPQHKESDHIRYSGSLLKYSFSEDKHNKSVTIVDIDKNGKCVIDKVRLTPRRDLRVIEGRLDDILAAADKDQASEDYVLIRLLDTHAILDVMGKLRAAYPNVLQLERPMLVSEGMRTPGDRAMIHKAELPMFEDFYKQMTGDQLDDESTAFVQQVLEGIHGGAD